MKFIAFWEWCPEDDDKMRENTNKLIEERKKFPDKYPKILFPGHVMGYCKGFQIYEANEDQRLNLEWFRYPLMKIKWVPISSAEKVMEIHQKIRK